jgi:hypothetical protein
MTDLVPVFTEAAAQTGQDTLAAILDAQTAAPTLASSSPDRGQDTGAHDFQDIFSRLPPAATPDMPPEVAQLAEIKGMMEKNQARMDASGQNPAAMATLDSRQEHLGEMYGEVYQGMDSGAVGAVKEWLDQNPAATPAPSQQQQPVYTVSANGPSQQGPGMG